MASKAKAGVGTVLKLGDGASPEVFTAVAEIKNLKINGRSIATDDVTNLDSAADSNGIIYKEYIPTVAEGGNIDFNYNWVPDATGGQVAFRAAFGKKKNFQIVTTVDNTANSPVTKFAYSFAGIVEEADNVEFEASKAIAGSGKIKVTGPITLA